MVRWRVEEPPESTGTLRIIPDSCRKTDSFLANHLEKRGEVKRFQGFSRRVGDDSIAVWWLVHACFSVNLGGLVKKGVVFFFFIFLGC